MKLNRVLVVDDDAGIVEVVVDLLREIRLESKMNFEIEVAEDGHEAFNSLRHKEYALVIMDLNMPIMDGHSLMEALKCKENKNPKTNLIILSGDYNDVALSLNDEHIYIITKPIPFEKLEKLIKTSIFFRQGEKRVESA